MKKLIIIDGNSLLFRAYFATANPNVPLMRAKDGTPTNAVFAFSNMLTKIINSFRFNEHIIVVFDTGKKTFRHQELTSYKANRKPVDQDLIVQMPIARDLLKALGIFTYELEGFEGDDIAGTAAKVAQSEGYDVTIYTSDKDFLQLIDQNIKINLIKKGLSDIKTMDAKTLFEELSLTPEQIPDYKGLMGDSSDNLKGIPGVGQKTAIKLLNELNNLENIIEASYSRQGKIYQSIIENQESGKLCKHLAMIKTDITLPFSIQDTIYQGFDLKNLSDFCSKYDLKTLMNKINQKHIRESVKNKEIVLKEVKKLPLIEDKIIGLYLNFDNDHYYNSNVLGIAISDSKNTYYLNVDDFKNDQYLISLLNDESVKKCSFDFKAIIVALSQFNISIKGIALDTLISTYLIDSSLNNNLDAIYNFYSISLTKEETTISLFDENPSSKKRTAEVSYHSLNLLDHCFKTMENQNVLSLYQNIELPLVYVLADMEIEGFPLNVDTLNKIGNEFRNKQHELELKIYEVAGKKFNISSPKQVAELFVELGIFSGDKKLSTSFDVLKKLVHKHPVVALILEYRKYAKLTSTYIDGLIMHVYEDGKLHPKFNQAETTTGRLSSSNPNLQNISVRDEEGKLIRKSFYYQEDYQILSFDYSQIELRILAGLSGCKKLIDSFNNDQDIHEQTAKYIFNKDVIDSNDRRKAKAVNFGIVYGISDWGLAEQLNIPPFEAKEIIKTFYDTYPEIKDFMTNIIVNLEKNGYVTTSFGRIRYLREIHDSSYQVREFAKRAAANAPIQGTAADIIKIAMIKISNMLKENHYKTKLVLQIHDELIFKVPPFEIAEISKKISSIMESLDIMGVKLRVDGGYAKTWYDAK